MIPKTIEAYYRLHAPFYDSTRWAFLFGRNTLQYLFPSLPEKPTILDLGCGTGKHLHDLLGKYPDSKIYALDQSGDMLAQVDQSLLHRVEFITEEYKASSFNKGQFDLILCSYSLSMMNDVEDTLRYIKSHLKPGAHLLVVDFDSTPLAWFKEWMQKNHVHFRHALFSRLKNRFRQDQMVSKTAFFGLYTYSSFLGKNNEGY